MRTVMSRAGDKAGGPGGDWEEEPTRIDRGQECRAAKGGGLARMVGGNLSDLGQEKQSLPVLLSRA